MRKTGKVLLLLMFIQFPLTHFGQGNGYIIKDGVKQDGLRIVRNRYGSGFHVCKVKKDGVTIPYNAHEISAYEYGSGKCYQSFGIGLGADTNRVFLKRLSSGKLNLYVFGRRGNERYFIQDSTAVEIDTQKLIALDENYREQLMGLVNDCPRVKEKYFKRILFNGLMLKKLVDYYNSGCDKPVHQLRYGVSAGVETRLPFRKDHSYVAPRIQMGYKVGAWLRFQNQLFNPSVQLQFFYETNTTHINYNRWGYEHLFVKQSSLVMPLIMRYDTKTRLKFEFGVVPRYYLKNEWAFYERTKVGGDLNKTHYLAEYSSSTNIYSPFALGFMAGIGGVVHVGGKDVLGIIRYDFHQVLNNESITKDHGLSFVLEVPLNGK